MGTPGDASSWKGCPALPRAPRAPGGRDGGWPPGDSRPLVGSGLGLGLNPSPNWMLLGAHRGASWWPQSGVQPPACSRVSVVQVGPVTSSDHVTHWGAFAHCANRAVNVPLRAQRLRGPFLGGLWAGSWVLPGPPGG